MVSWDGHIVPFIVTVMIWFVATGLVAWADNRDAKTFPKSILIGGIGGIAGLFVILMASQNVSVFAVYAAFVGALMVWGWHEIGFLTGAATGPRREPASPGLTGARRFAEATATVIHHEVMLALTALLLISLSWNLPNQIGATVFVMLFGLRLSAKINMYVGVPNTSVEMLPPHLEYLKTYFGPNRMTWLLAASILTITAVAMWFGSLAMQSQLGSAEMVGASLLTTLCLLGALEHGFLALPFRDGMLWGWAFRKRDTTLAAQGVAAAKPTNVIDSND